MKKRILYFVAYFLFWYLYFIDCRIIFLIYELPLTKQLSFSDILKILFYGSRMDLSMAGYYSILPALVFIASGFINNKIVSRILLVYTGMLLFITTFIVCTDVELYRNWGFRTDLTPLMYIKNPKEALASMNLWISAALVVFSIIYSIGALWIYRILIHSKLQKLQSANWKTSLIFIPIMALLILPIRGSLGIAPMNIGFVYFHKTNTYANHAAVNVIWNIFYSITTRDVSKPYLYFEREKAEKIVAQNYSRRGETTYLLKTLRPNILVIIMESFTAKIIEPLGGRKGITPQFTRLSREGVLFNNCYANGDRTDKGIIAILSGFPGHPKNAIVNFPMKTEKLPFLNTDLMKQGYYSGLVYGGDLDFANFRSYFINARYDKVISMDNFERKYQTSKWGVHDHIVFNRYFVEINALSNNPFFMVCVSQSSHEPFDVPMNKIQGNDEESKFLNAAYYADSTLGNFIDKAKKTSWWDSTLVVIVADHGHRFPGNDLKSLPVKYHIPMLWLGGALAKTDTIINTLFSQCDFPSTLLHQLHLDNPNYRYSQNFLSNNDTTFAFYVFNDGIAFLRGNEYVVFDNVSQKAIYQKAVHTEPLIESAKAQMQVLSTDFSEK